MAKPINTRERIRFWSSVGLIVAAILIIIIVLLISNERIISTFEQLLFQVFVLMTSLLGAYLLGLHSRHDSEERALKQYARAAFRRVLTLYRSLVRMAEVLSKEDQTSSKAEMQITLAGLQATVLEQLGTLYDALEDWRDMTPEAVEDIEERLTEASGDWIDGWRQTDD